MPTENWYPVTAAEHNLPAGMDDYSNNGGANKNASSRAGGGRAGPATHDDDTSYIRRTWVAGTEEQSLNIDWPGPMAATLANTTFNANVRHRTGGLTRRLGRFTISDGTHGGTAWYDVNANDAAYINTGPVDVSNGATYRPNGTAWVLADFTDDQTMFCTQQIVSGDVIITSVWGDIAYTPPAGGYAFLLNLVGGSLPLVGNFTDFAQFMRYLDWRAVFHPRQTKWAAGEILTAWHDVQAYRWPTFFLPEAA